MTYSPVIQNRCQSFLISHKYKFSTSIFFIKESFSTYKEKIKIHYQFHVSKEMGVCPYKFFFISAIVQINNVYTNISKMCSGVLEV